MKKTRILVVLTSLAITLLVASDTVAAPPTPHDHFLGLLTAIAPFSPEAPEYLCMCKEQSYFGHPEIGELRPMVRPGSDGQPSYMMVCAINQYYEPDGSVAFTTYCPNNLFKILPKK